MFRIITIQFLFICAVFAATARVRAQSKEVYEARIRTLDDNIYSHFYDSSKELFYETNNVKPTEKKHSYLWPLCALIQAANEEEVLFTSKNCMSPVMKAVRQYHSDEPPIPAYQAYVTKEERDSRFYDDNQWIAIACLDAYNRTKKGAYLDIAKEIYQFMMTGFDTFSGGGLYWREDKKTSKNTCANGPGIIVALELYKITHEQNYLDVARNLYKWVNERLQSPDGLFYDNIQIPSLKIDSAFYTYNAGTMLQSNVLLYNITGAKEYLTEAERIASAVKQHFYRNHKLPDNYWFNAVLLRGEIALYKVDKNKKHIQFFIADANRVWKDEKDKAGLVGQKDKRKRLIDQAAMIEIYARLAELK